MGCGFVMKFGGSLLVLMIILHYLGGMLVVLECSTAMATEQYPEVLVCNAAVLRIFLIEVMVVFYVLRNKEVEIMFKFNGLGDWVILYIGESSFSEEAMGNTGLYTYGTWLVIVTG